MRRANRNTALYRIDKQYICFYEGELDLAWPVPAVAQFREMWNQGMNIRDIAKTLKRHPIEVTILLISLAEADDSEVQKRQVSIYEGVGVGMV